MVQKSDLGKVTGKRKRVRSNQGVPCDRQNQIKVLYQQSALEKS
ncbi:MAG: hypothetical protein ACKO9I_19580 [Sphaerospermopsis kisseleviana]|jgi:hypothetical protein|nr:MULTISPECIES: hypothetical protein [Sphaerospermopsis]MEB3147952.1 hypothetical protein [Sphaerospermopsis sp.]